VVDAEGPQWAQAVFVELGQLGFNIDGDGAEEVDVLAVRRGDDPLVRNMSPAANQQT
jgi:hypothetical protein